jgi:hypothetical protein
LPDGNAGEEEVEMSREISCEIVRAGRKLFTTMIVASLASLASAQDVDFGFVRGIGGAVEENASSIALDSAGNIYIAGFFQGTPDFDPGAGTMAIASVGQYDGFVVKYDPAGSLLWAHTFGSTDYDYIFGVKVDAAGNVHVVGTFLGTVDFDPGPGTQSVTATGLFSDVFVLKLDTDGNFVWVSPIVGPRSEIGYAVELDASGNVYAMGQFSDTPDFDPGAGTANLTAVNPSDLFVLKLDSDGNFLWVAGVAGEVRDFGRFMTIDASGNMYLTAGFQGTVDFDPGAGTSNLTSAGDSDVFIWKLDGAGNFLWAHALGSTNDDDGLSLDVDGAGNLVVAGSFQGTVDFDPGAGTTNIASTSAYSLFVVKLTSAGLFTWAGGFTGMDDGYTYGLVTDGPGDIFVVGSFEGTADFDPGVGGAIANSAGDEDSYITKLDASGAWEWTEQRGTAGRELGATIIHDGAGSLFITGIFSNTLDFDTSAGTANLTAVGSFDTFFMKLIPKAGGVITSNPTPGNIFDTDPLTLIAPAGFSNYVWKRADVVMTDSGPRITGTNSQMLQYSPVLLADQETFTVTYDDGTKSILESQPYNLVVAPKSALPATGLLFLGVLGSGIGFAGYRALRKSRE